ncbi:MAG: hypothetical protein J3Q66DRAFT_92656 [Benniella sp.]|nr:MAG: hypothetical protein J3Q66DRAFT_92656 [Benniella sp.]
MSRHHQYTLRAPAPGASSTMNNKSTTDEGIRFSDFTASEHQRRYKFGYENPHVSGALSLWAGYYKKRPGSIFPEFPAIISEKVSSFEFNAFFRERPAGYYVVRWRVRVLENFSVSNGLRFQVIINYSAEEDTTGSLDVILPHEKLKKLGKDSTFNLELEEKVVVQPYQRGNQSGDRQGATVVVVMSNCTSHNDVKYSGLQVDHVELLPFNGSNDEGENVAKVVVERAVKPKSSIDIMKSPVFHQSTVESDIPISRLAWSKGGTFLAALALSDTTAYISVWNMEHWDSSEPEDKFLHEKCSTAVVDSGRSLKNLSIGLAISPNGSQLAVYQEPIVGEWTDGSELSNSTFPFHLLTLPPKQDTRQDKSERKSQVSLTIDPAEGADTGNDYSQDHLPPANRFYKNSNLLHPTLSTFIGYGSFLADHDIVRPVGAPDCTTQSTTSRRLFVACNGIFIDIFKITPGLKWRHSHSIRLTDLTPTISRRITCKMMMDQISRNRFMWLDDGGVCCSIWDLQKGSNISYVSSSDNTRLGCSTFRGNNTMSISPDESMVALANVHGVLTTFYASTGIAISSKKFKDGQQIEYVSFNGQNNQLFVITRDTITLELESRIFDPVRLNSGVSVNQVPVPVIGRTILAFFRAGNFKNNGLVCEADGASIRCYSTHNPVDIEIESEKNIVSPIEMFYPSLRSIQKAGTMIEPQNGPQRQALTSLEREAMDEPLGYSVKEPREEAMGELQDEPVKEPQEVMGELRAESVKEPEVGKAMEAPKKDKQYEVRTAAGMKLTRDDDDSMSWILRVEVVERHFNRYGEKVVFSFVPEPWMRISATRVLHPEDLLKVYFLPGQKRFVVAGIQTLQIWSLPANDGDDFNLAFIWSRPKVKDDLEKLDGMASKNRTIDRKANTNQKNPGGAANGEPIENSVTGKGKSSKKTAINGDDNNAIADLGKLGDKAGMEQNDGKRTGPGKAIETEPVGEYYHCIRNPRIYLDQSSGEAKAHIELKEGFGKDVVDIPGEHSNDSHSIFLNCARSIHLLAACYSYSIQESERFAKSLERSSFIFKGHAKAIARFTRGHINRLLPWVYFIPLKNGENTAPPKVLPGVSPKVSVASPEESLALPTALPAASRIKLHTPTLSILPKLPLKPTPTHEVSSRQLLKALEYAPQFDQELVVMLSRHPFVSHVTLEDQHKRWDEQREKFRAQKHEGTNLDGIFTVLTLLLDQEDLKDANRVFIEGLFTTADHEWIPHPSMALNPIKRVIDIKDERLLQVLIDYCIKNAKVHHPGYLTPVIQCLSKLSSEGYSDVMCDLFRRTSHIPARNPQYVASHAIVANLRFSDEIDFLAWFRRLFGFTKSSDINLYKKPVFSLQSQLPFHSHVGVWAVLDFVFDLVLSRRKTGFRERKDTEQTQPATENRWSNIYVSPFQFKPIRGRNGRRERSFLAEIAGKDFFDSPAVEASLWYKWSNSGLYFWSIHFVVLLVFFILVLAITGRQIHVSTLPPDGREPTASEITDRYLPGWQPVLILTIVIGMLLIWYEIMQMVFSPKTYFRSLFNLSDLAAYVTPVIGCFIFMSAKPGIRGDTGIDGGPSQISIMAFAILLLYLNVVFELRIIKPLGRAVNIITNVTKKIIWFLIIFAVFIISHTHALLYVLHTRRYRKCEKDAPNDPCKDIDYPSKYPTDFLQAMSTTYFFLSGRYDPVEDSFQRGPVGFRLIMVVFFFFAVILLLNILIALVNDAFNSIEKEGEIAYWKLLSEVIAELEMLTIYFEGVSNSDSYSEYIYYCASDEDIKKFLLRSTSEVSSLAEASKEAHQKTHNSQNSIANKVIEQGNVLRQELAGLKEGTAENSRGHDELKLELTGLKESAVENSRSHGEMKQELTELREIVKSSRDHNELRQELAGLKALVERPREDEKLKQELADLRGLVERPPGHDELKQELVELRGLVERPSSHDELKQELAELRGLVEHPPGHDELKEELSALKDLVKDLMRQLKSGDTST